MEWSGLPADIAAAYGVAAKDLFWVFSIVLIVLGGLRFLHYYGIVGAGADPTGTGPRENYDALRASLAAHSHSEDGYARRLENFLDKVDRFFGDSDKSRQRAFLLSKPAALWTAPAFDRCLLLAVVYPLATIFVIWAISGEVGPAERAMGLKSADGPHRLLPFAAMALAMSAFWNAVQSRGARVLAWAAVTGVLAAACVVAVLAAGGGIRAAALTVAVAVALGIALAVALAAAVSGVRGGVIAGAVGVSIAIAVAIGRAYAGHAAVGIGVGVATVVTTGAVVVTASVACIERGWHGKFLAVWTSMMMLVCIAGARYASLLPAWQHRAGPVLLFLGLLTLINAPFDWLSLGLTRLLLRRGIEQGGPWPYVYALIDALVASFLIALLALAMVSATDWFNALAALGGGKKARVLKPMRAFLDELRAAPEKPEYWWVYATLFSTMLPSLINLFIAGFSFLRGLPILRAFLRGVIREGEAMPVYDRLGAALILTSQGAVALAFAIAAQVFLTWVVFYQSMPRLGLGILDLAKKVAM